MVTVGGYTTEVVITASMPEAARERPSAVLNTPAFVRMTSPSSNSDAPDHDTVREAAVGHAHICMVARSVRVIGVSKYSVG
jgi:hypothetical protein